jgi:hypothetical protein
VLDVNDLEGRDSTISTSIPRDRDVRTHHLINKTIDWKKNIRFLFKELTTYSLLHSCDVIFQRDKNSSAPKYWKSFRCNQQKIVRFSILIYNIENRYYFDKLSTIDNSIFLHSENSVMLNNKTWSTSNTTQCNDLTLYDQIVTESLKRRMLEKLSTNTDLAWRKGISRNWMMKFRSMLNRNRSKYF